MKKVLLLLTVFLASCTPSSMMLPDFASDFEIEQSTQPQPNLMNEVLYDENGNVIPDFVPALQPFVNEGCNTAWDNLSAIIEPDGTIIYFTNLPDYTPDSTDYDKSRFTFIYQARNPWFGMFPEEEPYAAIAGPGWYTLPVDDYGSMTCIGVQEIRIWVLDGLTGVWYMNSQVCWAGWLCSGQEDCDQYIIYDNEGNAIQDITQIEYTTYDSGHIYLQPGIITNY